MNNCIKDRYRELLCISRQWRNLEALKRAGVAHDASTPQDSGGLAVFCPTCPQPGINVSDHEVEHSETLWVLIFLLFLLIHPV